MLVEALLAQETLNRAEFVALMDEGKMPEGSDEDKPRVISEILKESSQETEGNEEKEPDGYQPPAEEDRTEYLND
jgi:hypothetical protein